MKSLLDAVSAVTSLALLALGVRWAATARSCALRIRPVSTVLHLTDNLARGSTRTVDSTTHTTSGGTA